MSAKAKQDLITGLVIYAFLLFMFTQTSGLPAAATLYPRMVIVLFAVLNTAMILTAFKQQGDCAITLSGLKMPLLYFGGIVIYVFVFGVIGYFPATAIMLAAFMFLFNVRPWWKIAIIVAGFIVFTYVMFVVWLGARLV